MLSFVVCHRFAPVIGRESHGTVRINHILNERAQVSLFLLASEHAGTRQNTPEHVTCFGVFWRVPACSGVF